LFGKLRSCKLVWWHKTSMVVIRTRHHKNDIINVTSSK